MNGDKESSVLHSASDKTLNAYYAHIQPIYGSLRDHVQDTPQELW